MRHRETNRANKRQRNVDQDRHIEKHRERERKQTDIIDCCTYRKRFLWNTNVFYSF